MTLVNCNLCPNYKKALQSNHQTRQVYFLIKSLSAGISFKKSTLRYGQKVRFSTNNFFLITKKWKNSVELLTHFLLRHKITEIVQKENSFNISVAVKINFKQKTIFSVFSSLVRWNDSIEYSRNTKILVFVSLFYLVFSLYWLFSVCFNNKKMKKKNFFS